MKLRSHLITLVVASLLPVLLFAGVMIHFSYHQQRADIERGMVDTARALSLAVDRELDASIRTLQALASSEHFTSGDLGEFYRLARDAIKGVRGWEGIALIDPSGQQILNLRRPFGTRLPPTSTPDIYKEVTERRAPAVSDLFHGAITQSPRVLVGVPVIRGGQIHYVLQASISPRFLVMLLSQQKIPADWIGAVIDRKNIIIARTRDLETFMGQPANPQFVSKSAGAEEGWFRNVNNEGNSFYAALSRSRLSGWTVALAIPAAEVEVPLRRTLVLTGIGGFLLLGIGIFLASILGYRIARAAAQLTAGAQALGRGETLTLQASPIVELGEVGREIEAAAADRGRAEEALRQAQRELESKVEARTRELFEANTKLQELDRLKSEFLATMSHELRTPLNSIIGFTGIMLQGFAGDINAEQKKQLSMAYDSAKLLLGLINDILDLSKIESGKFDLFQSKFKIDEVASEVIQSLVPMISHKDLKLFQKIPQDTPAITSDRKRIFQILLNLVNNAIKFTEKGEIRIECRTFNGNLEVSVTDTGIGIKKENMAMLFESFRQVDGTSRRRYEGTGLGLYLCQKLVTLLGGSIRTESEYGKGSRFTFVIPVKISAPAASRELEQNAVISN